MHLTVDEQQSLEQMLMTEHTEGRTKGFRPMIIIPAFASSRLRVWQSIGCTQGLANFKPGGDVWMDSSMYFSARTCWLECILINSLTQQDTSACKSRPDEGLDAITELDPGLLTGALTTIWKKFILLAASIGLEPHSSLFAAPYDFRLALPMLETRDGYFSNLKLIIQQAVKLAEKKGSSEVGAVVIAHSMGNVVFRYFIEWLKADLGLFHYQEWLNKHIHTFIAGGPPTLGAAEALEGHLSGNNLGLIGLSNHDARRMGVSFGSSQCITPRPANRNTTNYARVNSVPYDRPVAEVELLSGQTLKYDANDVVNGKLYRELATTANDELAGLTAKQQEKFYIDDPIASVLSTPWERPPIRRVICAYGIGRKTPIAYKFRERSKQVLLEEHEDNEDPSMWEAADVLYEEGNKIYWSSGNPVDGFPDGKHTKRKSGDGTVPYSSLSWCHTWLGERVNITRIPQDTFYSEDDLELYQNVTVDSLPPSTVSGPHNVLYEHAYWDERRRIRETAVWEFDDIKHRAMMEAAPVLSQVKVELLSTLLNSLKFHKQKQELMDREQEAEQHARIMGHSSAKPPTTDAECLWDYGKARCKWSKYCVYDYKFGDYHLSQSCRLRKSMSSQQLEKHDVISTCECIDHQCISGFCKYKEKCANSVQAFGPSNGYWGACETSASTPTDGKPAHTHEHQHNDL